MKTSDLYGRLAAAAEAREAAEMRAKSLAADLNKISESPVPRSFIVEKALAQIDDEARQISSECVSRLRGASHAGSYAPVPTSGSINGKGLPVVRIKEPGMSSPLAGLVDTDKNPLAVLVAVMGETGREAVRQWLDGCAASAGTPSKGELPQDVAKKAKLLAAELAAVGDEVADLDGEIRQINDELARKLKGQPEAPAPVAKDKNEMPTQPVWIDASVGEEN